MKKIIYIFLLIQLSSATQAQYKKGFGFTTGAWGSGFHFMGDWELNETLFSGFELRFIDVKNDGEMPAINYYTGQTMNIGDDALIMFPAFAKMRYLPFEGKIANNFSPFIEFKIGLNYAIDGNGNARTFRGRWSNSIGYASYGGQFVVGVIFPQVNGTTIITSIGFETLPMNQRIDGRDNYDGMTLNISYVFRNRN
ncbi:MAG: hypothetical protein VYA83_04380 [Candidatus Neomarinimicrobiota bacterium]|nr:hypothetical protein [Candidatus Neomarinimicrobiota bacterium]MEC7871775.1 hypothetical protein [Candidatus Neomarinimicrobiota bacterium]MEC9007416.1 hypothetical protein [Candidatus Neomarinimicrobiota bacterium]MEC9437500.1 hypothetical protein [Candidatus Neomarinimicrobiota bacterium]MED5434308.1 hypothetical protein [Candidatus Neomarinimicrobiota bacterium]|tara:strand:- start:47 stop:634 length:588 start_codon:yes stop_codon:yes gene_type:complete